jgi:phosphatidylinositol glycan class P protein
MSSARTTTSSQTPEHSPAPTPVRAVYGFVFYLLCSAALATYFVWAFVPDDWLDYFGLLDLFPQKYWAVAVPIYLGVAFFLFTTVVYPSLGLCITPDLDDPRNVVDEVPRFADADGQAIGDVAPGKLLKTVFKKTK